MIINSCPIIKKNKLLMKMRIFDKKKLLLQPHPKQREKGADQNQETMNEKYYQTLKSAETEDWLDFHVVRPIC